MATMTLLQGGAPTADEKVRSVVRMLLAGADMKPADLAKQLGMSKHQVWDRLRGDKAFTVAEVVAMAEIFEVPAGTIIAGPQAFIGRGAVQPTMQKVTRPAAPHGVPLRTRPTGRLSLVAA